MLGRLDRRWSGGRLEGVARPAVPSLELLANAKVNLFLEVLGRRPDGFHEIRSWMVPLSLADRLIVSPGGRGFSLEVPGAPALETDDNLVLRAARAFQGRFGAPSGARLRLWKRIPVAAGLGGGSSDAAATLRALASHLGLRDHAALLELGAALGSDVPFFLGRGPALVGGRGERLEPAPPCPPLFLVVAKPPFGISAADAYRALGLPAARGSAAPPPAARLTPPLADANWSKELRRRARSARSGRRVGRLLVNDLQAGAVRMRPELSALLQRLSALSPLGAAMAGSGSCCFGLFPSAASARGALAGLRGIDLEAAFVTRTQRGFSRVRRLD